MADAVLVTRHIATPAEQTELETACRQWGVISRWMHVHPCRLRGPQDWIEVLEQLWHLAHQPMPHGMPES